MSYGVFLWSSDTSDVENPGSRLADHELPRAFSNAHSPALGLGSWQGKPMMPSLWHWIAEYGYVAVFVGCLLEGEMLLLLAGVAAHEGKLSLPLVIFLAFVAGTMGDQLLYWIGRRAGRPLLDRWTSQAGHVQRVKRLLTRFDASLIFGIRFMYGLRLVGPLIIGASYVRPGRFAVFNMLGAAVWAPLVSGVGYFFGYLLAPWTSALDGSALIGTLIVAVLIAAIHRWRRQRRDANRRKTAALPLAPDSRSVAI